MNAAEHIEQFEPLSGALWLLGQAHRDVLAGLESLVK